MRRETKLLLDKACDSLLLGIELYNRPSERGRTSGVLILADHALEMILKAAICHKGGSIHERDSNETIGFEACVRRGTSDGDIKFLTEEQALTLRTLNALRDAAQHYLVDVSEGQLYLHIQSAVTLFRDLLWAIFDKELRHDLPQRVPPISASPPTDIFTLFDSDIKEILKLLAPGKRRRIEAQARLRSLVLFDARLRGEEGQPSVRELTRIGRDLIKKPWGEIFHGVAKVEIASDGVGPSLSVRITKREGPPTKLVAQDTIGATPVAVKRVNELDFYNLNATRLAGKVGLTTPKLIAVVEYSNMRSDEDCYKEFKIDGTLHKRYSQRAIQPVAATLRNTTIDEIWQWNKERLSSR